MPRTITYIIIVAISLGLVGCEGPTPTPQHSIDPVFREFHQLLGGEDVLGPAISPILENGDRKIQYTNKVLMVFDPQAPESMRYQLHSLGIELGVVQQPLQPASPDGFDVYSGFLPLFRQLGGTRYTGKPLTNVYADSENKRIVQYFENVGFYQLESDPPDTAHLLDYGAWKCAQACGYQSPGESIVVKPSVVEGDFAAAINRLTPTLIGFPLSDTYIGSDGQKEQIYENVVIYSDPTNSVKISLRPLPELLNIPPDSPHNAGQEEGKFIAVSGDQGFTVPYHLDDYITQNNGYDFLGYPISEYKQINDGLYRQCFENICLDYRSEEGSELQIRPMSLGRRYQQQVATSSDPGGGTNSFSQTRLTVWERYPVISSSQTQEILALVQDNGKSIPNLDLVLYLTLPDGSQQTENFLPTDSNGQTRLSLPPIEAANGKLVVYQVCIDNINNAPDCIVDDFLIWGNP